MVNRQGPDDNNQVELNAAQRKEQHNKALSELGGMVGSTHWNGQDFQEPQRYGQGIQNGLTVGERQLVELASGSPIDVSGNPDVATQLGSLPSPAMAEVSGDVLPERGLEDFDIAPMAPAVEMGGVDTSAPMAPAVEMSGVDTSGLEAPSMESAAAFEPSLAEVSKPTIEAVAPGLPEIPSLWPPGAGVPASQQQIKEQQEFKLDSSPPSPSSSKPIIDTKQPQPVDAGARRGPVAQDGSPQMQQMDVDWGTTGDMFGESPTATENTQHQRMTSASDSIGMAGSMLLSVIEDMTKMLLDVTDGLADVKDRLDSKDECDLW